MIISTSSHNVLLTDDICQYVEDSMRNAFGESSDHVVSIDARLEAIHSARNRANMKVNVRVELLSCRVLITEIQDDNLHAAVWRAATDSARATSQQARRPWEVSGPQPEKRLAFDGYSAANI